MSVLWRLFLLTSVREAIDAGAEDCLLSGLCLCGWKQQLLKRREAVLFKPSPPCCWGPQETGRGCLSPQEPFLPADRFGIEGSRSGRDTSRACFPYTASALCAGLAQRARTAHGHPHAHPLPPPQRQASLLGPREWFVCGSCKEQAPWRSGRRVVGVSFSCLVRL